MFKLQLPTFVSVECGYCWVPKGNGVIDKQPGRGSWRVPPSANELKTHGSLHTAIAHVHLRYTFPRLLAPLGVALRSLAIVTTTGLPLIPIVPNTSMGSELKHTTSPLTRLYVC